MACCLLPTGQQAPQLFRPTRLAGCFSVFVIESRKDKHTYYVREHDCPVGTRYTGSVVPWIPQWSNGPGHGHWNHSLQAAPYCLVAGWPVTQDWIPAQPIKHSAAGCCSKEFQQHKSYWSARLGMRKAPQAVTWLWLWSEMGCLSPPWAIIHQIIHG